MSPLRSAYRRLHRSAFRLLRRLGLNGARTGDYYSPLPVLEELARTEARWNRPSEMVGIPYDLEAMKALLGAMAEAFGSETTALPPYGKTKTLGYGPGFTEVDAQVTYWMIRHLKPARYLEVGSGLSTWYAWQAVQRNEAEGHPCTMACIDPYSTTKVHTIPGLTLHRKAIQETSFELFEGLGPGDVFFIDSTHVVKVDGDVPFVYLEAVPRLGPGVWIHSHDIHFPYNVPHPAEQYLFNAKWPMFWTEAMLLQAFLSHNPNYHLELAAPMLRHFEGDFLAKTLPNYRPTVPEDYDTHFGSVWYRRVG